MGTIEGRIKLPKEKQEIKDIDLYYTIDFNDEGILVKRTGDLGKGKQFRLTFMRHTPEFVCEIKNRHHLDENYKPKKLSKITYSNQIEAPIIKEGDTEEDEKNSSDQIEEQLFKYDRNKPLPDKKAHIPCDNPLCILKFKTIRGQENHSRTRERCKTLVRSETIESWFETKWINKYGIPSERVTSFRQSRKLRTHMGSLKKPKIMNNKIDETKEGCSRRQVKKAPKRLNNNQKKYLYDIFVSGIHEKRKARAYDVEKQMRRYKEDGEYYFTSEEWLSEQKANSINHVDRGGGWGCQKSMKVHMGRCDCGQSTWTKIFCMQ